MSELDDIKARAAEDRKYLNARPTHDILNDLDLAIAIAEDQMELTRLAGENEQLMHVERDEARAEVEHLKEVLASEYTVVHAEIANAQKARTAALTLRSALIRERARHAELRTANAPETIKALAETEWLEEH